nr:protein fluG [Ipomoea batatas]GMD24560.1 protein fluG [Ipomoea batatas]GMD71197.1 protein fluG [Ipomoea batatas]
MEGFAELKEAVEKVKLVDAHAHNIVSLHSKFPFLSCFSEATGDALSSALHTINFKVCLLLLHKYLFSWAVSVCVYVYISLWFLVYQLRQCFVYPWLNTNG